MPCFLNLHKFWNRFSFVCFFLNRHMPYPSPTSNTKWNQCIHNSSWRFNIIEGGLGRTRLTRLGNCKKIANIHPINECYIIIIYSSTYIYINLHYYILFFIIGWWNVRQCYINSMKTCLKGLCKLQISILTLPDNCDEQCISLLFVILDLWNL